MSVCKMASACCGLLLAMQSAWAAPTESQERAARRACLLGDVAKGTEILADLYLDTKDPNHIYNQGRCYEQNGQNDQAILRFREYLRKAEHLPAVDAAAVEKKISQLQDRSRNSPQAATPPVPAAVAPAVSQLPPAPSPVPSATAPDPLQISQPSTVPAERTPAYQRWWFWGGIGVVVVGAVVTTVLLTSKSDAQHSPPCAPSGAICVEQ